MYKEVTLYEINIFIDFIDKINKSGEKCVIHFRNGNLIPIFPSQRFKVVNDKFLKVIDEDGIETKLFKIDNIVGVERI